MWSYLITDSLINPLPGYVENIAGDPERLKSRKNDASVRTFRHMPGLRKASHTEHRLSCDMAIKAQTEGGSQRHLQDLECSEDTSGPRLL